MPGFFAPSKSSNVLGYWVSHPFSIESVCEVAAFLHKDYKEIYYLDSYLKERLEGTGFTRKDFPKFLKVIVALKTINRFFYTLDSYSKDKVFISFFQEGLFCPPNSVTVISVFDYLIWADAAKETCFYEGLKIYK